MLIFVGALFVLIGLAVFVSGIFAVLKVRRQLSGSSRTFGRVFAFGTISGQRGYLYCPQVEFAHPNGQTIRFQSETGSQPPAYAVGQEVKVVYQNSNPNQAEIDSVMALWFAPGCTVLMAIFFTLFGLAFVGIGIFVESLANGKL